MGSHVFPISHSFQKKSSASPTQTHATTLSWTNCVSPFSCHLKLSLKKKKNLLQNHLRQTVLCLTGGIHRTSVHGRVKQNSKTNLGVEYHKAQVRTTAVHHHLGMCDPEFELPFVWNWACSPSVLMGLLQVVWFPPQPPKKHASRQTGDYELAELGMCTCTHGVLLCAGTPECIPALPHTRCSLWDNLWITLTRIKCLLKKK